VDSTIVYLVIFTADLAVRLVALGPRVFFCTSGWHYMDLFVRAVSPSVSFFI
jgi:hypothetical protein